MQPDHKVNADNTERSISCVSLLQSGGILKLSISEYNNQHVSRCRQHSTLLPAPPTHPAPIKPPSTS
eukprot:1024838-Amphidinium_carterae.1